MERVAGMMMAAALLGATPATAQGLDGLYWADDGFARSAIACDPAFTGSDGGPSLISGRNIQTGGNACTLSSPRQEAGGALRLTMTCDGEGTPFDTEIRITGTADGFMLEDLTRGRTTEFIRC